MVNMLHQEVVNQWSRCKEKISLLRSKSIDNFKDKEVRSIHKIELMPDTHGNGSTVWEGEHLLLKGLWKKTQPFTQKIIIYFEIWKLRDILDLVEDQTEEDRKFLRTKTNGTFVYGDELSETNLRSYGSISGDSPTIEEID